MLAWLMPVSAPVAATSLNAEVDLAYRAAGASLKRQDFAAAVKELKPAADAGYFMARFYSAWLYGMPNQPFTDHAKSFEMLKRLVAQYKNVDPYLEKRTPFIARAEILLAYYYRRGVPELDLQPNPLRFKAHLEHAALQFGDTDAQFELGRLDLESSETVARGLDTLDNLAVNKHHALAAAEIARVYSDGKHGRREAKEALAYALLAARYATGPDKLDVGDIYQTLYCRSSRRDRSEAHILFQELEQSGKDNIDGLDQPIASRPATVEGVLDLAEVNAVRECSDGELVPDLSRDRDHGLTLPSDKRVRTADAAEQTFSRKRRVSAIGIIGPPMGIGLRDLEQPDDLAAVDDEAQDEDDSGDGAPAN